MVSKLSHNSADTRNRLTNTIGARCLETLEADANEWGYWSGTSALYYGNFKLGYLLSTGKIECLRIMFKIAIPYPSFVIHTGLKPTLPPMPWRSGENKLVVHIYPLTQHSCFVCTLYENRIICRSGGFPLKTFLDEIKDCVQLEGVVVSEKHDRLQEMVRSKLSLENLCATSIRRHFYRLPGVGEPKTELSYRNVPPSIYLNESSLIFKLRQLELPRHLIRQHFDETSD